MAITIDELKRNVFPGESGGDYNALFGYANRPGGQFAGTNLTDMTVDQALQFSSPSGPYGQSVKGQIGRVATPMGAWQVVGTTLKAAKQGLGLTGSEKMTPELQDAIGMWIYQNQGPGAWEGWGKGGGGSSSVTTMSSKGGAKPMGLLDMQDEPQTFAERLKSQWQSGELKDRIALAANTLRMNPDQNLASALQGRQQAREERATINKTAQWLALQGREDLAQAMLTGGLDAKSAVAVATQDADPLAAINLEKARLELQKLKEPQPDFRPATAEEAAVYGATSGQIGPDGRFYPGVEGEKPTAMIQNYEYWISQGKSPEEAQALAKAGAGGVTVDLTGESQGALNKELAKAEAGIISTYLKQGPVAAGAMQDLTLLGEVLQYAPQDPVTGRLAELLPGVSSAGAAASSIIKRVAPTLRAEGSGSTSDIEYAGMLNSLPSLQNYPEANAVILDIMKAKAAVDIERSQVVRDFANSQQTPEDARAMRTRLSEIDSRSIMTPDMRRVIDALSGAAAPGGTGGGNGQPVVIDGVTIQKVN